MNNDVDHAAILGKKEIKSRLDTEDPLKKIYIYPLLASSQIQPASVDIRLGPKFNVTKIGKITHIDPLKSVNEVTLEIKQYLESYKILNKFEKFILHPNEFVLGSTLEYLKLPTDIGARIEGRSSWGRLGVLIHSTAGFIDPGFCGNVTLELKNVSKIPIALYPGVRIGQLSFFKIQETEPYTGKYQNSFGTVSSKYFKDEEYDVLRESYHSYDKIISELFGSLVTGQGIPESVYQHRLPKELIDAIVKAYMLATSEKSKDYDENE